MLCFHNHPLFRYIYNWLGNIIKLNFKNTSKKILLLGNIYYLFQCSLILKLLHNKTMSEEDLQNIPELLGENVRKYRKQAGLTQEELSERLGITQKHLSVIENGTQFASATLIAKLSKELNVTPGFLFGGDMSSKQVNLLQSMIHNLITSQIQTLYLKLHREIEEIKEKL